MRGVIDFLGANLFLLAVIGMGAGAFWLLGVAVVALVPDANDSGWPWLPPLAGAIAAMYFGGRALHRFIGALLYSPTARPRSGPRSGAARPGAHHHS